MGGESDAFGLGWEQRQVSQAKMCLPCVVDFLVTAAVPGNQYAGKNSGEESEEDVAEHGRCVIRISVESVGRIS